MVVYLNDLSCGDPAAPLVKNFSNVNTFFLIADKLKSIGASLIVITGDFKALKLCDTLVAECFYRGEFGNDHRNLLLQLRNYFVNRQQIDGSHIFSHPPTQRASVLLGNAHYQSRPAISFTFNPVFATETITGIKDGREAKIANIYDYDQELDISAFVTSNDCKQFDPTVTPIWNTEATRLYHKSFETRLKAIKAHPDEKIPILCEGADTIALLNGWEYDEVVTKLNKTDGSYRRIYRSAKFRKTAYLSVDFEKPEIFFELHNHKGTHLGEYYWDGTPNKNPDPKKCHNIEVC